MSERTSTGAARMPPIAIAWAWTTVIDASTPRMAIRGAAQVLIATG